MSIEEEREVPMYIYVVREHCSVALLCYREVLCTVVRERTAVLLSKQTEWPLDLFI